MDVRRGTHVDAGDDAHGKERRDERAAAVGEERQSDTGVWNGVRYNHYIKYRLDCNLCNYAENDKRCKFILASVGDFNAADKEERKQNNDCDCADKAELLADDCENEVVLRLGNIKIFLF